MSLFYKTINIMGKFIKVSRDDLLWGNVTWKKKKNVVFLK